MLPKVTINPAFTGYRCVICSLEQDRDFADNVCPQCGVDGILDVIYDYDKLPAGGQFDGPSIGRMWRFWCVIISVKT